MDTLIDLAFRQTMLLTCQETALKSLTSLTQIPPGKCQAGHSSKCPAAHEQISRDKERAVNSNQIIGKANPRVFNESRLGNIMNRSWSNQVNHLQLRNPFKTSLPGMIPIAQIALEPPAQRLIPDSKTLAGNLAMKTTYT